MLQSIDECKFMFKQESIPVGCVPPTFLVRGDHSPWMQTPFPWMQISLDVDYPLLWMQTPNPWMQTTFPLPLDANLPGCRLPSPLDADPQLPGCRPLLLDADPQPPGCRPPPPGCRTRRCSPPGCRPPSGRPVSPCEQNDRHV